MTKIVSMALKGSKIKWRQIQPRRLIQTNYSTKIPNRSSTITRSAATQRMLDFDYASGRETPSVAAIINPTGSDSYSKFFFGKREILMPMYKTLEKAAKTHPKVDVMINFASFRSAASSTEEALAIPQIQNSCDNRRRGA